MVRIPAALFCGDEEEMVNQALGSLFSSYMVKEKDEMLALSTETVTQILLMMPKIRKWQIGYTVLKEEFFNKGIALSSSTIRDKVRNNASFLKEHGIAEEEMIKLLEEFIREFTDRIFKKKK